MSFSIESVRWNASRTTIIDGVTLHIPAGTFLGILGPNGSGKSSLLRMLAGLAEPTTGRILLDENDLHHFPARDRARRIALVTQDTESNADITVHEVVSLGRIPHRSRFMPQNARDHQVVRLILKQFGLESFSDRGWSSLSGGERQRVNIARAFAQEPTELLLDEFTNHLDIHHQLGIFEMLESSQTTVVTTLHDLNLAARYCTSIVLLDSGRIAAVGTACEVLTPQLIRKVYKVESVVTMHQGRPHISYIKPTPTLLISTKEFS